MSEQLFSSVTTILIALVGLGIIATLVSRNANTAGIISSGGSAFSRALTAAEGPVLGNSGLNIAGTYQSAGYMF
jgi:PRD1 phage membrane DNA delivery